MQFTRLSLPIIKNIVTTLYLQPRGDVNAFCFLCCSLQPICSLYGFRTFRQKTFRQKHGGGRFGKKNAEPSQAKNISLETFRMICGAYPVYARSPSPSQRPAPTTIASRSLFPLGLCSCSTLLSKMGS